MSKVEGHAEGERGSEEVQARLYGRTTNTEMPFLTFPFMRRGYCVPSPDINTASRYQRKVTDIDSDYKLDFHMNSFQKISLLPQQQRCFISPKQAIKNKLEHKWTPCTNVYLFMV